MRSCTMKKTGSWLVSAMLPLALVWSAACGGDPAGVSGGGAPTGSGGDPAPTAPPLAPGLILPPRAGTQSCLPDGEFPLLLSETGCFADAAATVPGPDLIPYDVASALWTDGAHKQRWIVLPPGQHAALSPSGALDFPPGSILVKRFALRANEADAATERAVEYRFMVREEGGWRFASYAITADGSTYQRVEVSEVRPYEVRGVDGTVTQINYLFPEARACTFCHSSGVEPVFGPSTLQLSKLFDYGGTARDQLEVMAEGGLFGPAIDPAQLLPERRLVDPGDNSADLEARARSWLHANCSHCHQPGGWAPANLSMDLRFQIPLAEAETCATETQYFGRTPRIKPGDAAGSAIWRRITSPGINRMPPTGISVVDPGAEVVRQWIDSLAGCPQRDD